MIHEHLFRTVRQADGSRHCGFPLQLLDRLPAVDEAMAMETLSGLGFEFLHVNVVERAMELVGKARYERAVHPDRMPNVFDCSGLTWWAYRLAGVGLPRRSIQQSRLGHPVMMTDAQPGDLLFTPSRYSRNRQFSADAHPVGHVGMYVGEGEVLHASNKSKGLAVVSLSDFWWPEQSSARRLLPERFITVSVPKGWHVHGADDLICIIDDAIAEDARRRKTPGR